MICLEGFEVFDQIPDLVFGHAVRGWFRLRRRRLRTARRLHGDRFGCRLRGKRRGQHERCARQKRAKSQTASRDAKSPCPRQAVCRPAAGKTSRGPVQPVSLKSTGDKEEEACARKILTTLAHRAYDVVDGLAWRLRQSLEARGIGGRLRR